LDVLNIDAIEKYGEHGYDEIDWSDDDAEFYIRRYGDACEYIGTFEEARQYLEI
jgi:hypothetical protein